MDLVRTLLFENPVPLIVVMAVAEVAGLLVYRAHRRRELLGWLLAPPAVAGMVGLLASLVQTDRERIRAALDDIAARIVAGDLDGPARYLDPACRGGGVLPDGRDELIAFGKAVLRKHPVRQVRLPFPTIRTDRPDADATVNSVVSFRSGTSMWIVWRLKWARRDGVWRIVRVEMARSASLGGLELP